MSMRQHLWWGACKTAIAKIHLVYLNTPVHGEIRSSDLACRSRARYYCNLPEYWIKGLLKVICGHVNLLIDNKCIRSHFGNGTVQIHR